MGRMDRNLKNWANIFKFYACKNRQKIIMVNAPWWNLFDILLISLTDNNIARMGKSTKMIIT